MAIVGGEDLNNHMSNPQWTEAQEREADRLCARLEQSLGDALGAPIDPIPWSETASVSRKGLVCTKYPVARVTEIGGVTVAEDAPLPNPWLLAGHWVRLKAGHTVPSTASAVPLSLPVLFSSDSDGLAGLAGFGTGLTYGGPARNPFVGQVDITYMAGWGEVGTLTLAVLRKAEVVFGNRNADTVEIGRGTDAARPQPKQPEHWTAEELAADDLQYFRNIHLTW